MSPHLQALDQIASRLDTIRAAIRRLFLLDGVARVVLAVTAFVAATFILDWTFNLPRGVRAVFLVAGLAGLGWLVARRIVRPLAVRISDDDLAIFVERHYPELNDRLISALQLTRMRDEKVDPRSVAFNSPELVDALVGDATSAVGALDFNAVVVRTHVHKIAMWAGICLLAMGAAAAAAPRYAGLYVVRDILCGTARWPQRTYLKVLDFDENRARVVARGDDLTIVVTVDAERNRKIPSRVTLYYEYPDSGERGREQLSDAAVPEGEPKMWTMTFTRVPGPFRFYLVGGDDTTDPYVVHTQNPPSLEEMALFYDYPDYLALEDTPDDRPAPATVNIVAPQFSTVRFVGRANEELESATLVSGPEDNRVEETLLVDKDADGRARLVKGRLTLVEAFRDVELVLKAKNGLLNRDPIRFSVKGTPDQKPIIGVPDPAGDETATEICERPFVINTKDDHGLRAVAVEVRVVGAKSTDWQSTTLGREHNRPPEYGKLQPDISSEYVVNIGTLGAKPGEVVLVRIHAEDWKNLGGEPNVTKSREYKFTIVPITVLEKELQDAIDKIKQTLEGLRRRQNAGYERVRGLNRKYGSVDQLGADHAGEIKAAALEQNDITSKLDSSRRDVERVMRRGRYNKIFDDKAAAELGKAVTILKQLADMSDPSQPAVSGVASGFIAQAARAGRAGDRADQFTSAMNMQSEVLKGIAEALRYLDRWSNYQEIVRMTREILEEQKKVNDLIKDLFK